MYTAALNRKNNKKLKFMLAAAIVAAMFALFLIFNMFSGYAADDYLYFFKYAGHNLKGVPQRLTGIGDIIAGMKVHYNVCNGRIPAHFMLQLFTLFGKNVFNVCNSLMFVFLGLLIYRHANIKGGLNIPLLIFVFAFEWLGTHLPATVYLWFSGAFNYLWTTTFILAFMLIYRDYAIYGERPGRKKRNGALRTCAHGRYPCRLEQRECRLCSHPCNRTVFSILQIKKTQHMPAPYFRSCRQHSRISDTHARPRQQGKT